MGKLIENLNLTKQMYMLAGAAVISQFVLLGYIWLASSASTSFASVRFGITVIAVVASILVSGVAYYLGLFNAARATTMVSGLNALAKGDLGKKIDIRGKYPRFLSFWHWVYVVNRRKGPSRFTNI